MMRTITNGLWIWLAAITVSGCSADEINDTNYVEDMGISISVSTTSRIAENAFVSGDRISIYAYESGNPDKNVINNITNTLNGSVWTPAAPMEWKDPTTAHDFIALHPIRTIGSYTDESVTLGHNPDANDLMVATTQNKTAANGAVPLVFEHIMSKVSVSIALAHELAGSSVSTVMFTCKKEAKVNYVTKEVTASGAIAGIQLVSPAEPEKNYTNVVAPQTLASGTPLVEITIEGKTTPYIYKLSKDLVLSPKKIQQINLLVGVDKVELGGITISDWVSNGPTIDGGAIQ